MKRVNDEVDMEVTGTEKCQEKEVFDTGYAVLREVKQLRMTRLKKT